MGHFQFVYVDRHSRKEETEPKMFNDCAKYVLPCLSLVNISKKTRSLSYPFQKWPQMKHSGVSNLEGSSEVVSVLFYYSFNVWNI